MAKARRCSLGFCLLVFFPLVSWFSQEARAATFTVDSTADAVDANPGDGICATITGTCTLRAAVQESNALPGIDVICVPAGFYPLGLFGSGENAAATGDLDITDDLVIKGAGTSATIIEGFSMDRVFDIAQSDTISVTMTGLTVQGGSAPLEGGGIRYGSRLTMRNCRVRNCDSNFTGGGLASTNGIFDQPRLTMVDCVVRNNDAPFFGGSGGGIDATFSFSLLLIRCDISSNNSGSGGGGIAASTMVEPGVLIETTVADNTTGPGNLGIGGGIRGGCLLIDRCTISGNSSSANGGGIQLTGNCGAMITNTTISGNEAGTRGGGLSNSGTLLVRNVTIADNTAVEDSGGVLRFGVTSSLSLQNTIVANNTPDDCGGLPLTSLGNNLDSDGTCNLTEPSDLPNTNPLLGLLQDNGGPTETHALAPLSPAINAADGGACPDVDQRNAPRPQGGGCDIGAYEAGNLCDQIVTFDRDAGGFLIAPGTDVSCCELEGLGVQLTGISGTNGSPGVFTNVAGLPGSEVDDLIPFSGNYVSTRSNPANPESSDYGVICIDFVDPVTLFPRPVEYAELLVLDVEDSVATLTAYSEAGCTGAVLFVDSTTEQGDGSQAKLRVGQIGPARAITISSLRVEFGDATDSAAIDQLCFRFTDSRVTLEDSMDSESPLLLSPGEVFEIDLTLRNEGTAFYAGQLALFALRNLDDPLRRRASLMNLEPLTLPGLSQVGRRPVYRVPVHWGQRNVGKVIGLGHILCDEDLTYRSGDVIRIEIVP